MRCIGKKIIAGILCSTILLSSLTGCKSEESETALQLYEKSNYNTSLYTGTLLAEDLCVSESEVAREGYIDDTSVDSAALFDLNNQNVMYAYKAHEKIYPASITKIMTALLTLENGNLDDMVTISSTADADNLIANAQTCGLQEGDVWKLEDLLNALLIYSGNDVALAIAEHIGGSVENFVNMMNQRAYELCATNTHFMNPHGLHDDMHYTTAYDLYLIFNECIKDERFVEIIDKDSCTITYTTADGSTVEVTYEPTNLYSTGVVEAPETTTIVGGKTGTTDVYSRCLILLVKDKAENPYISVIIGAPDKTILYADMSSLLMTIP